MSTFVEIKQAIDGMNTAFEEFKKVNDQRLEAVKSGNEVKARELDEKLVRIDKEVSQFSELRKKLEEEQAFQKERLEELEAKASAPGKTAAQKRHDEYKSTWIDWLRNKGQSPMHEAKLQDLQRKMIEAKDVTIGT